ncbi:HTH-type transcriptional repressor AseR [compost metagenome]
MAKMLTLPEVSKSLADETRLRATLLIASQGELCVCELMFGLEDSQPKISSHLALLRGSGLLRITLSTWGRLSSIGRSLSV